MTLPLPDTGLSHSPGGIPTAVVAAAAVLILLAAALPLLRTLRSYQLRRLNRNVQQFTLPAAIVSKRVEMFSRPGAFTASTRYYITFELCEADERIELPVESAAFGLLIEGDHGDLTYQGTLFHDFVRENRHPVR